MTTLPRTLEPEVMDAVEEAKDYDTMDHSMVNRLFVDDLLTTLAGSGSDPTAGGTLHAIDLGTGTALIPLELLSRPVDVGFIIACDLSLEMLKIATAHLVRSGNDAAVLAAFCDAKRLPVADRSCDVVMSNSIVHHIPDPRDVFFEMRRVVRPGGTLFVRDLLRPQNGADVEQLVRRYAGAENPHQQQMFRQSLHAALTVSEVRSLLSESGFRPDWVSASSDRHWTIAGRV